MRRPRQHAEGCRIGNDQEVTRPGELARAEADIAVPVRGATRIEGDIAIGMGASRVDAKGRIGDTLNVDARLAPLQLDDFLPAAGGSLRGTLAHPGARNAPNIAADLSGMSNLYLSRLKIETGNEKQREGAAVRTP